MINILMLKQNDYYQIQLIEMLFQFRMNLVPFLLYTEQDNKKEKKSSKVLK